MHDLTDKTILITGASAGIGAATARAVAAAGGRVALAARNRAGLEHAAASLPAGSEHLIIPADVTDEEDVRRMVGEVTATWGGIDVLVNNAGVGIFKEIAELSVEEFDRMIAVNLRGVFLCVKEALPQIGAGGAIVTVASLAGRSGFAGGGGYCASKFGVMGLMESLFHECRARDIRTITLAPGSVDTGFFDSAGMTPPLRETILQPEDVAATIVHALTLPPRALLREIDIRPANPRRE